MTESPSPRDPAPGAPGPRQGGRASRLAAFVANPRRAVWSMTLPMMAGMLLFTLYQLTDTFFIGQLPKETALAAMTFAGPAFFLIHGLTMGIATGVTAVVAQAIGAHDERSADRAGSNALGFGATLGLTILAVASLGGPWLLEFLGAEGAVYTEAWSYFRVVAFMSPITFLSQMMRAILAGEGDTKTPMKLSGMGVLLNVALDPWFIFGPENPSPFGFQGATGLDLGMAGAAWATFTTQCCVLIGFAVVLLVRRRTFVRITLRGLIPDWVILGRVLKVGLPAALQSVSMAIGNMVFAAVLATFGVAALAGYTAASRVDMIVSLPVLSIAVSTTSIVGMFKGAKRTDLIRSTMLYTYRFTVGCGLLIGVTAYLLSTPIIQLFVNTETATGMEALNVGHEYLGYAVFIYPLMGFGMNTGRGLQGLGHGMPTLVMTLIRVGLAALLAAILVFSFHTELWTVWAARLFASGLNFCIGLLWIRALVWGRDPAPGPPRMILPTPTDPAESVEIA